MSVRWRIEQDTRFNVPVRVDITDANYVGSIINLQFAGKSPVIKTGGVRNSDPYKKIFGESITVNLKAQTGDFEDLFTRDRDRFRIKLYVNGSFDSEYIPITDAYSEPVTGGNFISTIKGAGLASLKQIKATDILTADNYSALEAIYELTNHFFNYSIVDGTIFYPDGSNTTTSALSQIDIKTARFKDESAYQALEYLISRGHQIRVQDGSAHVIPAKESSYTGYSYNGSTISSGVTYNTNLSAQPIGGRTAINRRRQQYYDGVLRTYEPGSAGNIVPSGDFSEAEFSGITGEEVPAGWSYDFTSPVLTNQPISSRAFDGEEYAWQFNPTEWLSGVGEPRYFQATGEQIISGERLSVNAELKFNKEKSSSQVLIFLLEIKIGSHYLIQQSDQSGRINNPKNLVWSTSPPSRTSGEGSYLRISVPQNIRQRFTVNAPPAPVSGQISYRVAVSTFNGGYSKDDTINIYTISNEIVDEDGKVTSKSEHSIGTGDIYNFTEYFGDGFTSATPGALFYNNSPTEFWSVKGISGTGTLAQVQSSYIQSEISRDNDLYFGTYDVYDAISLIEGKRVGYISTDYRYGVSKIELLGIEQHSISTTGDDDEDKDGITVGPGIEFPEDLFAYYQLNAIGETTQDYEDATITSLAVDLDQPIRSGIEYFVVNENELDSLDRDLGIYPFIPDLSGGERVDYGPGELSVAIQEQVINAPSGSLIVKAPGQTETEENVIEERVAEGEANIDNLNNVELPALQDELDTLNNTTLPNLQDDLDAVEADLNTLNTVTLPNLQNDLDAAEADIATLNNTTIPNLQSDLDDLNTELDAVLPITETDITDGAISTPKLAANAVTAAKILADTITANEIAAGTITALEIASDTITANEIVAGTITALELGANSVTAIKIDSDAVTTNKIQAGAIVSEKIGAGEIKAINIDVDAITTNKILAGAITTVKIGANQVTANKIDVADLYATDATIGAELKLGSTAVFRDGNTLGTSNFYINADGFNVAGSSLSSGAGLRERSYSFYRDGDPLTVLGGISFNDLSSPTGMDIESTNDINLIADNDINIKSNNDLYLEYNSGDSIDFLSNVTTGSFSTSQSGWISINLNGVTRRIKTYSPI